MPAPDTRPSVCSAPRAGCGARPRGSRPRRAWRRASRGRADGARQAPARASPASQHERGVLGPGKARPDADLGAGDLPLPRLATELADGLDDVVRRQDEGLCELPAALVSGQRPTELDPPALDERAALATPAEPLVLELLDHEPGEVVVERDEVDVRGRETRHSEGSGRRVHRPGGEVVLAQARVLAVGDDARAGPEDDDRPGTPVARALERRHDEGA